MTDVTPQEPEAPLRLIWPQWQGAGPQTVAALTPELPFPASQLGYHLGSRILAAIAPATSGVTVTVPTDTTIDGLGSSDGIYAREVLAKQLRAALDVLDLHQPARVVTLGGECSVSVAPFSYLADRYGEDLAVLWVDAHPDVGTPEGAYDGYHAMAVSHLVGRGDPQFQDQLPATVPAQNLALVGLHEWEPDQEPAVRDWGLTSFTPEEVNGGSTAVTDWLRSRGTSKVAIHVDVDVVDSEDIVLGLGQVPGGLTRAALVDLLTAVAREADVVGLTVAEYVPRQALALQDLLAAFPLLGDQGRGSVSGGR